ncbi:hypothetical protein C8Z91_19940 [Paenibacillus elgii]|uniref:Antitoxin VbhA domain-containing protein n=1 Tax=Paenibacillus elgii TaxID=189691 RepID=A0A2T6G0D0_9BACL|nr:antitoxin VbhA family protein [Paenibacillus elgii]PUA37613.1 hypothetical protein C8Z91_19940 [Paenibacillus elgii]
MGDFHGIKKVKCDYFADKGDRQVDTSVFKPTFHVDDTSDKDVHAAMRQAQASLAIEGLFVPENGQELVRKRLRGEISQADFLKAALEIATRE